MRELNAVETKEVGGGNWCNVGRDAAVGAGAAGGAMVGLAFGVIGAGVGGYLGSLAGGRGFDAVMEHAKLCQK